MKKTLFLAIALLLTTAVAAEEASPYIGRITNQAGGSIVLLRTDNNPRCYGPNGGQDVLSYNKQGDTAEGCWFLVKDAGLVKIVWNDGTVRVYRTGSVELNPNIDEENRRANAADASGTSL